jgi:hypothetical protein
MFVSNLRTAIALLTLLGGCELTNPLPKNECRTSSDCNPGNTCQSGMCQGTGVGGGCSGLPPAACSSSEGELHHLNASELQRLLPGRWLWCTGDTYVGQPFRIGGPTTVGFEFNADATRWWPLDDDGHGQPTRHTGFDSGGTVQILSTGAPSPLQLLLVQDTGFFGLLPEIADGPPLRLRLNSFGHIADYILAPSGCGGELQPAYDGGATPGPFGDDCNTNTLLPNSCPSVGGVACSMCGYEEMRWQCLQPCSLTGGGCPAGQSCQTAEHTRSGDCVGFDGYCH